MSSLAATAAVAGAFRGRGVPGLARGGARRTQGLVRLPTSAAQGPCKGCGSPPAARTSVGTTAKASNAGVVVLDKLECFPEFSRSTGGSDGTWTLLGEDVAEEVRGRPLTLAERYDVREEMLFDLM
mmetsp:Transcript_85572/g.215660  ORF Transcript_85572/g.215660 Transcript_85572/m.215660 type:complete len:126 (-) Transcript_85572:201-578(-)|eukprot:CAMPEP_0115211106 /NCGR_PEP_ID=MMETSP0270-20121206/22591_1 /TAXON_ID=71861 /ORGANISM="Scrippsiella trochoidea, Strain CCMP3099" /LENGTH=125 /DNA_ID=CAMNT_0002624781 /DNA_START=55 /DNA_END=432 /DNA_ORIENTATION=-